MADETFDWGKFDKTVDTESLAADVKDVEENGGGDFPDIPAGTYEVIVTNMELGKSKVKKDGGGGDPMLKIQFKIMAGEFKDNYIFYNGVMQPQAEWFGFQTHNNNTILTALGDGDPFQFENFKQYNEDILDLFEDITQEGDEWHYELKQSPNKKNPQYNDYEILGVLD